MSNDVHDEHGNRIEYDIEPLEAGKEMASEALHELGVNHDTEDATIHALISLAMSMAAQNEILGEIRDALQGIRSNTDRSDA